MKEQVPAQGDWAIDAAHTSIEAVARHMMVTKVRGRFTAFSGNVHVGPSPEESSVEVEIDAASIDTGNEQRDTHLRSADFLDVEGFPTLSFRSTKVERKGRAGLAVTGDLTIRGVTKPLVLEVEAVGVGMNPWGSKVASFSATGEIDREEFGMTWNQALETGGVLVSKKLKIEIEVEAVAEALAA